MKPRPRKVLAISSGGGHWVQLLRLRPAFEGHHVTYATVSADYRSEVGGAPFRVVPDATRWDKLGILRAAAAVAWLLVRVRPDVIVSTGALPGFLAVRFARLVGARSLWLDSIANVEKLSLSGERVGPHADLWLTQWQHLEKTEGPRYRGAVL
jgi:UDP-N-acetylglucosamine:LPS N-acetylglucosamine transferase